MPLLDAQSLPLFASLFHGNPYRRSTCAFFCTIIIIFHLFITKYSDSPIFFNLNFISCFFVLNCFIHHYIHGQPDTHAHTHTLTLIHLYIHGQPDTHTHTHSHTRTRTLTHFYIHGQPDTPLHTEFKERWESFLFYFLIPI